MGRLGELAALGRLEKIKKVEVDGGGTHWPLDVPKQVGSFEKLACAERSSLLHPSRICFINSD